MNLEKRSKLNIIKHVGGDTFTKLFHQYLGGYSSGVYSQLLVAFVHHIAIIPSYFLVAVE